MSYYYLGIILFYIEVFLSKFFKVSTARTITAIALIVAMIAAVVIWVVLAP